MLQFLMSSGNNVISRHLKEPGGKSYLVDAEEV